MLLFQAVRELLLNVTKHCATPEAWVRMGRDSEGHARIEVEDRGPGFDPEKLDGNQPGQALGLFGLRERLQAVRGEMQIDSAPGDSTRITLRVPIGDSIVSQAANTASPGFTPQPQYRGGDRTRDGGSRTVRAAVRGWPPQQ